MLRQATLLPEDSVGRQDPSRPVVAHLHGRVSAKNELVMVALPPELGLAPHDDYAMEVESFRVCFDASHNHSVGSAGYLTSSLPGKRVLAFHLDGHDDDDDDPETLESKRIKRAAAEPRPSILRITMQWTFKKPPVRAIDFDDVGLFTPLRLITQVNQALFSMLRKEFLGVGFPDCPEFYWMQEGRRVVLLLPPLAVVGFVGSQKHFWHLLGFRHLETVDADSPSPFQALGRGDYALANFSPLRSRLFVSDVSVSVNASMYVAGLAGTEKDQTYWRSVQDELAGKVFVSLHRTLLTQVTGFDLSSVARLQSPPAASHVHPLAASKCLDAAMIASFKAFGISETYSAYLDEAEREIVNDIVPYVNVESYPSLAIAPLHGLAEEGFLRAYISAGREAETKAGFKPTSLSFDFDAAKGYTSTGASPFLHEINTDPEADWNEATEGSLLHTLTLIRTAFAALASDVTVAVESVERTTRGPLAEAKKKMYLLLDRSDEDGSLLASMPADLTDILKNSDTEAADYELPTSDYQGWSVDRATRQWHGTMTVDASQRVVPVIPEAWTTVVTLDDWEVRQSPVTTDVASSAAKPLETEGEDAAEASSAGQTVMENPDVETGGGGEEVAEERKIDTGTIAPVPTGDQPALPPPTEEATVEFEAPPFLASAEGEVEQRQQQEQEQQQQEQQQQQQQTAEQFVCFAVGGEGLQSERKYRRLCPLKQRNSGEDRLPDLFHLTLEEGERVDWLGPLGYCSYLGSFKGGVGSGSGERIRSHEALLRGCGLKRYLTFRIVSTGYDAFVPVDDGLAIVACRFHPYRTPELGLAMSRRRF